MAVAQATKSVKKASANTKKPSKSTSSHPPYIDMITEALVSLKERTGSSHYAIAKHIEEQQKVRDLPSNFKKLLFNQLKKGVASGKLVMVKKSFKLPSGTSKKSPVTAPVAEKPKPKSKEVAAKKPAKTVVAAKPKTAKKQKIAVKVAVKVAKSPAKKIAPAKAKKPKSIKSPAKKMKSIKSPAKKATAVKKTTAMKKTKK
ncbi:hypothetical protein BVRB_5g115670 [Beta vulgaris subsp. vulgaris]|nr:hypothetical protein BVRB_5g115670 [Beta vulgaris subsp. vulgaris]